MGQRPEPLTTAEMQEIDTLLATGMSQKKIAQQIGQAQSTISLHCKRTGQVPTHRTPTEAIQRHVDLSIERRIERTGQLMDKVMEIALNSSSGREVRECAVSWGILNDKLQILQGNPSSISESRSGARGAGTFDLAAEFAKLEREINQEEIQSGHPGEEYAIPDTSEDV
jgi:predicted transcriptional regulator